MASFGDLRSLLQRPPTQATWARLCELLDELERARLEEEVFPYIEGRARAWPDELRVAPQRWVERAVEGGQVVPFWSVVRALDLSCQYLGAGQVIELLASPRLARVTHLDLSHNRIEERGAVILAQESSILGLVELRLAFNHIGPRGAGTLARAGALEGVEVLELEANDLGERGALALAEASWLGEVRALNLIQNGIGSRGVEALLGRGRLARLERLILDRNPLGSRGAIDALIEALRVAPLRRLELRGCEIEDEHVEVLAGSGALAELERLDLSRNPELSDRAARALASRAPQLRELSVARTDIGRQALLDLVERGLPRLERLVIAAKARVGLSELKRARPELTAMMGR